MHVIEKADAVMEYQSIAAALGDKETLANHSTAIQPAVRGYFLRFLCGDDKFGVFQLVDVLVTLLVRSVQCRVKRIKSLI